MGQKNYFTPRDFCKSLKDIELNSYSFCFLSFLTLCNPSRSNISSKQLHILYKHTHTCTHGRESKLWLWNWRYLFSLHSCTVQRQSWQHQSNVFGLSLFQDLLTWLPSISDLALKLTKHIPHIKLLLFCVIGFVLFCFSVPNKNWSILKPLFSKLFIQSVLLSCTMATQLISPSKFT